MRQTTAAHRNDGAVEILPAFLGVLVELDIFLDCEAATWRVHWVRSVSRRCYYAVPARSIAAANVTSLCRECFNQTIQILRAIEEFFHSHAFVFAVGAVLENVFHQTGMAIGWNSGVAKEC